MYNFYSIDEKIYLKLKPIIKKYNECLHKIVLKSADNKLDIIKEKNRYDAEIREILSNEKCILKLGYDDYKKVCENIFTTQLIEYKKLYQIVIEIDKTQELLAKSLKEILLYNNNLCIWIV